MLCWANVADGLMLLAVQERQVIASIERKTVGAAIFADAFKLQQLVQAFVG